MQTVDGREVTAGEAALLAAYRERADQARQSAATAPAPAAAAPRPAPEPAKRPPTEPEPGQEARPKRARQADEPASAAAGAGDGGDGEVSIGDLRLPAAGLLRAEPWSSANSPDGAALLLPLADAQPGHAFVMRGVMPVGSARFAVNLVAADDPSQIFVQVNPRKQRGGQVLRTARGADGQWAKVERQLKGGFPFALGAPFVLGLHVVGAERVVVSVDGRFVCAYDVPTPLPLSPGAGTALAVQLPAVTETGAPESVEADRLWWGRLAAPSEHGGGGAAGDAGAAGDISGGLPQVYVGGLSRQADGATLKEIFARFDVRGVRVLQGKGCGFVTVANAAAVTQAMRALNGKEVMGMKLRVSRAVPQH